MVDEIKHIELGETKVKPFKKKEERRARNNERQTMGKKWNVTPRKTKNGSIQNLIEFHVSN